MEEPVFAVVGHPNKGKSSLVSTLARDTSVAVGLEPGTTRETRDFPMQVDGKILYTLTDTPGFQRARAALDWMKRQESGAASRPSVVTRFVKENEADTRFHDECRLLRPIVEGAGIIYVVDGAVPYGPEYEAEMEILRWTGQPSMAVINPIGEPRYVEDWQRALGQFFRVVRVLDVMKAPFEQQVDVLRAFGQLRKDWRDSLEQAVEALLDDRRRKREAAVGIVARLIEAVLVHRETLDIPKDADPAGFEEKLAEKFRGHLRRLERRARVEVERIYGYKDIESQVEDFEFLDTDLLSQESWLAFGLKRRDLLTAGAVSGAVIGGTVDVALLGTSFLTGSLIGGVVGGALGYFSSDRLAEMKILTRPLGGQRLHYGPSRNLQLPFVLLNRARLHHLVVAGRTHAQRGALEIKEGPNPLPLSEKDRLRLARSFTQIRKSEAATERRANARRDLAHTIAGLEKSDGKD